MSIIEKLEILFNDFKKEISDLKDQASVLNLKSKFLGKKGEISNVLKSLKDATPEERREIGPKANDIKEKNGDRIAVFFVPFSSVNSYRYKLVLTSSNGYK